MTSMDDVLTIAAYGGFEFGAERGAFVATEFSALWPMLERLSKADVGTTEPATRFVRPKPARADADASPPPEELRMGD